MDSAAEDHKVYFAVGFVFSENVANLRWVFQNFRGQEIVFIHVIQQTELLPQQYKFLFRLNQMQAQEIEAYAANMRLERSRAIDTYLQASSGEKVKATKVIKESETIERGIIELIGIYNIKKLVMGGAAPGKYNQLIGGPLSKKATHVKMNAPSWCQIWFVSNGVILFTRDSGQEAENTGTSNYYNFFRNLSGTSPYNTQAAVQQNPYKILETNLGSSTQNQTSHTPTKSSPQITAPATVTNSTKTSSTTKEQDLRHRLQEYKEEAQESRRKVWELEKTLSEEQKLRKQLQEEIQKLEKLLNERSQISATSSPSFQEFTWDELSLASNEFDIELQIGRGGFGTVYKGHLRHTDVAIKRLNPDSSQGEAEFRQEINILTRVRHTNLITLIGACPSHRCLVYEFLSNGSLEDRLFCKDGTQPIWWSIRFRIAAELCLGILFLHSTTPEAIVHGDLKPANILLDANNTVKIADFGICKFLPQQDRDNPNTVYRYTAPVGTEAYIDPQFVTTGELTTKSDVYAFGVISLQLLTGKPSRGLVGEVQHALENRSLRQMFDKSAGNWPLHEAEQLAKIGLKCCEVNRRDRPDLESEVWPVLQNFIL